MSTPSATCAAAATAAATTTITSTTASRKTRLIMTERTKKYGFFIFFLIEIQDKAKGNTQVKKICVFAFKMSHIHGMPSTNTESRQQTTNNSN